MADALIERGYDWKVTLSPDGGSDIVLDCRVKQPFGFSNSTEIDTDTDDPAKLTMSKTLGKPKINTAQFTVQLKPELITTLLGYATSTPPTLCDVYLESRIVADTDGTNEQMIANVLVISCETDSVANDAFPTMTITLAATGGVSDNDPTVATAD